MIAIPVRSTFVHKVNSLLALRAVQMGRTTDVVSGAGLSNLSVLKKELKRIMNPLASSSKIAHKILGDKKKVKYIKLK